MLLKQCPELTSSLYLWMVLHGIAARKSVGSKPWQAKSTFLWDLIHRPLSKQWNRFKWTTSMGGSFQIWSFLDANCLFLQFAQSYFSSWPSSSCLVKASKHFCRVMDSVAALTDFLTDSSSTKAFSWADKYLKTKDQKWYDDFDVELQIFYSKNTLGVMPFDPSRLPRLKLSSWSSVPSGGAGIHGKMSARDTRRTKTHLLVRSQPASSKN